MFLWYFKLTLETSFDVAVEAVACRRQDQRATVPHLMADVVELREDVRHVGSSFLSSAPK